MKSGKGSTDHAVSDFSARLGATVKRPVAADEDGQTDQDRDEAL